MKRLTIIGAGVSGLSLAQLSKNHFDVQIIEKADKPGGLIKCDVVDGNLFHKVGGHVFNAKNKKVFDWFWSHFDQEKEFIKARRNARIFIQNKLIGYPIENYLFEFESHLVSQIVDDLLTIQARGARKSTFEYPNFEEFLKGNFGQTLYQLYFEPYNKKIWNTNLEEVSLEWLEGKLPMPQLREILLSNIIKEEESDMVHSTFYYPKQNGSQFIADRLSKGLNIKTSAEIKSIKPLDNGFLINDDFKTDLIAYTGDIRKLADLYKNGNSDDIAEALEHVQDLKSNGTSNLLCECDPNDISWLYIPEPFTKAHRIIYTGNFSPANNSKSGRRTCVVEFSGLVDPEIMNEEIKKLPGNLKPLRHNYEPNSYVIQDKNTRSKVNKVKSLLEPQGIFLTGRFAEWEYYNMDKAIEAAMETLSKLGRQV